MKQWKQNIMSLFLIMMIYWLKTCIIITYHSDSLASLENCWENEAWDFKQSVCEIWKNETIERKFLSRFKLWWWVNF